jgi:hypothetical protein
MFNEAKKVSWSLPVDLFAAEAIAWLLSPVAALATKGGCQISGLSFGEGSVEGG